MRNTCAALLDAAQSVRQALIGNAVEKLGAPPETVKRFEARAAIQPQARAVMVETSPEVARVLGLNAENFPIGAFLGALAGDLIGFGLVLKEIRALKRELEDRPAPAPKSN